MVRATRWVLVICGVLLMALSGAGLADSRPDSPAGNLRGGILGAGDTIHIAVFQNPDLTTDRRISERGSIMFPLIGEIALAGATPAEGGARIAARLKAGGFLVDPQVNVSLVQVRSRQVSVLGHVARPGRYPLEDTTSRLTDVLALAGGISESGDNEVIVSINRDGQARTVGVDVQAMYKSGDMSGNIVMEGGDAIYVPSARVFYIYGEVQRGGAYRLEPAATVMNAISLGGGLTPRGTDRGVQIRRRMPDGQMRELSAKLSDPVEPDDVIFVGARLF
jgi:polysaccharide export outer membrane protein